MNPTDAIDDELRDIHAFQPIVIPDYLWWIFITAFVVGLAYFLYKYFFSKKKENILTLYEKTLAAINALDTSKDCKTFYLDYSDIVRGYLLERVNLNLFDKTLNELRFLLDKGEVFDMQSKNKLLNIFAKADMAKFAKREVPPEKRQEHLDETKEILAKLENKLEEANKPKSGQLEFDDDIDEKDLAIEELAA